MARFRSYLMMVLILMVISAVPSYAADDIRGAWQPVLYKLKDGTEHQVTGLIMFTEKDWSVLFLIMEEDKPQRASSEGGTYTLDDNKLVFSHLYHFAGGQAVKGITSTDLVLQARKPSTSDAPTEPCTIEIKNDMLSIYFPSGNLMRFRRSSGF